VDHWAITLAKHSETSLEHRGISMRAPAGTPFVLSLGEEMRSARAQDERVQLYLARDSFRPVAAMLDAATATALTSQSGRLLAEFMLLLDRNLPELNAEDVERLPGAIQGMIAACLVPSAARIADARPLIRATLMERVRRAVNRNLRPPSLRTETLCREAATSRSQLYRLLESEGGVANYIQRRRLSESFSLLCDSANGLPIGRVAEMLCFADASTFSRAFRREFGISPSDVRAAAVSGLAPVPLRNRTSEFDSPSFSASLRA
jgi:AraC-like DNA-binding protein